MAVSVAALRDTLLLGWWTAYPRFMPQRKIDVRDEELDGLKLRTYSTASGRYPVVVLHGLTHNGFDDGRLTPFCRDLAATGFITCSPDLEGLRELDLDETDIERIVRTVAIAHERHGRKVGIIGFSVGGTYGLIAAAELSVGVVAPAVDRGVLLERACVAATARDGADTEELRAERSNHERAEAMVITLHRRRRGEQLARRLARSAFPVGRRQLPSEARRQPEQRHSRSAVSVTVWP